MPGLQERSAFAKEFLRASPANRMLFGCTELAVAIADRIEVSGFVDDTQAGTKFHDMPVIASADVLGGVIVLSTVTGVRPVSVERHLDELGVHHVDFFAFDALSQLELPEIRFHTGWRTYAKEHLDAYRVLLERLGDAKSQMTLNRLLSFRLDGDLAKMAIFEDHQHLQYFAGCVDVARPDHVFFDLGAFDGFTSLEFARRSPEYRAIHAFEPVPESLDRTRSALAGLRNVTVHAIGASNENGQAAFADDGSSSRAATDGKIEVELRRLDDVIDEPPSFVKIDVEGAELEALEGMRTLCTVGQPTFALAAYHRPSDLLDLVGYVDEISDGYTPFIRHYTEGTTETVLYMVPDRG